MKKIIIALFVLVSINGCKKEKGTLIDTDITGEKLSTGGSTANAGGSSGNTWTLQGYAINIGRRNGMSSFVVNNKGYAFGGVKFGTQTIETDIWEYDPVGNTWTNQGNLPFEMAPRFESVGFAINGKGYIATGRQFEPGNVFRELIQFDPAVYPHWTRKADFPGEKRYRAVGFCINGKGYVGLGIGAINQGFKDLWEYDPVNDAWTQKADLPGLPRYGCFSFVCNNKAYIGCGSIYTSGPTKQLWEYDPASNAWAQKTNYPGLATAGIFSYSNNYSGFAGAGLYSDPVDGAIYAKDFWQYSPLIDTWTKKKDFGGYQRKDAIGFYVNSRGYAGLGTHSVYTTTYDLFKYNP